MVPRKHLHRNGIRIAYSVVGEGPLVLFIHGLAMSSRAWLQSWQPLVERGFRVAAIDNRGTGQSTVSMPPYSMREMASDTAYLLEHLGGGPAIVAGLSLGGMIAQHLTIRNPHLVSGLVLAATTVGNPFGKLPRPEVLRTLTLGLLGHRRSGVAMRQYLVHAENLANDPDLFREFDRAVLADGVHVRGVLGQLAAAARHNTYFSVRKIHVPVEIVAGDTDALVPTVNASLLARRIHGSELTILPRAGHAFPLERPEAMVDAVLRVHQRISR